MNCGFRNDICMRAASSIDDVAQCDMSNIVCQWMYGNVRYLNLSHARKSNLKELIKKNVSVDFPTATLVVYDDDHAFPIFLFC